MSTYISEPGTRLAGRYRLTDQVAGGSGWILWKAIDETLARPVSVLTFAPGFPRIPQVVTAARAASRQSDPRLAQVFDVDDSGPQTYIVLEWVSGDSLTDLLDGGPLDPALACSLISDAARAIAGAHGLGQAHLRLTPDTVRWSRGSGIKITGLGIDAALAGDGLTAVAAADPAAADTIALAALLYAALTGYWPGDEPTRLPAAPVSDGTVCTPRQVSADVSSAIDSVITRALLQRQTRQGPPILSPADFAEALAMVAPPVPLPEPAPPAPPAAFALSGYDGNPYDGHGYDGRRGGHGPRGTAPYEAQPSAQYPAAAAFQGRRRRGASPAMLTTVVVLAVAVLAVAVWAVGFRSSGTTAVATGSHPSTSASAAGTVLKPTGVVTFNPYGSPPGNTENQVSVQGAIDKSLSTAWSTSYYYNRPNFGGLKPGTGLLINMGQQVRLSQVEVLFSSDGGPTTAAVYLGNNPTDAPGTALSNFTLVSPSASVSGDHTFPVSSKATGQYVLIWITSLPKLPKAPAGASGASAYYEAQIFNVVVRGGSASGTS